jgi:hypothetical protein
MYYCCITTDILYTTGNNEYLNELDFCLLKEYRKYVRNKTRNNELEELRKKRKVVTKPIRLYDKELVTKSHKEYQDKSDEIFEKINILINEQDYIESTIRLPIESNQAKQKLKYLIAITESISGLYQEIENIKIKYEEDWEEFSHEDNRRRIIIQEVKEQLNRNQNRIKEIEDENEKRVKRLNNMSTFYVISKKLNDRKKRYKNEIDNKCKEIKDLLSKQNNLSPKLSLKNGSDQFDQTVTDLRQIIELISGLCVEYENTDREFEKDYKEFSDKSNLIGKRILIAECFYVVFWAVATFWFNYYYVVDLYRYKKNNKYHRAIKIKRRGKKLRKSRGIPPAPVKKDIPKHISV